MPTPHDFNMHGILCSFCCSYFWARDLAKKKHRTQNHNANHMISTNSSNCHNYFISCSYFRQTYFMCCYEIMVLVCGTPAHKNIIPTPSYVGRPHCHFHNRSPGLHTRPSKVREHTQNKTKTLGPGRARVYMINDVQA